jgi:hypothetical protein
VKADGRVRGVTLMPGGEPLLFVKEAGRVQFTVPKVRGYQMMENGH